jgi:hypothetical protein
VNLPLINVILPLSQNIVDAWVFDKVVALQLNNKTFAFYEKTLVASNYQTQLKFNTGSTPISSSLLVFDMDVGSKPNTFTLYGAGAGQLIRYDLVFDQTYQSLNLTNS